MTPWTKQANGIFIWVILFQILLTCGIVMWTDSNLLIGIAGGLFISAGGLAAIFAAPSHSATPHIVAISTMLNTALHIHLGYGLTELHFELFALLAIVAMYRLFCQHYLLHWCTTLPFSSCNHQAPTPLFLRMVT